MLLGNWFFSQGREIRGFQSQLEKTGIFSFLLLFVVTAFFLLDKRLYLSPQVFALQQGGEITREGQTGLFSKKEDKGKTVFSYRESITVDGNPLTSENIHRKTDKSGEFLLLVNNDTLFAFNSPLKTYLPTLRRHGLITYTVREGDTLGRIAANFGVSLNTILWANHLRTKSVIRPGQKLTILPVSGVLHRVKKGETLSYLARKYRTSIEDIMAFNNLSEKTSLKIGQDLIIPGAKLPGTVSLAVLNGLKPMEEDVSHLPSYAGFYLYPTAGGWNKGILHYYNAVDIINSCGSPIYAAAGGMILKTGYDRWYGKYIKIQHYNGTITVYGHLSKILVEEGQIVKKGNLIGRMGDTGNARGCHLHFEVRGAKNPFVLRK